MLLLIKKHPNTSIEETKRRPQETVEVVMNKQMQTLSYNPLINLAEEGKWLLGVTSFEATNSVFNITHENNSFSISIPSHWNSDDNEELINQLNKYLKLRSENDIELHVYDVRKTGDQIKIGENEYIRLSDLDTRKNQMIKELKRVKYKDLEDMVYGMELTYNEIIDILNVKSTCGSTIGFTLLPDVYEISDIKLMLKSILPKQVKVKITIDDIRLKSNLTTNKTIRFTKRSFLYTLSGFTQSHSGPLGDIKGFIKKTPGTYKSKNLLTLQEWIKFI